MTNPEIEIFSNPNRPSDTFRRLGTRVGRFVTSRLDDISVLLLSEEENKQSEASKSDGTSLRSEKNSSSQWGYNKDDGLPNHVRIVNPEALELQDTPEDN